MTQKPVDFEQLKRLATHLRYIDAWNIRDDTIQEAAYAIETLITECRRLQQWIADHQPERGGR